MPGSGGISFETRPAPVSSSEFSWLRTRSRRCSECHREDWRAWQTSSTTESVGCISTTLTTAASQIRAGRARGLAISAESRLADFPDIPTYREMGYPDLVATVWFSLSGPANMPTDIVERLNAEVNRALEQNDVRERLKPEGIVPSRMSAPEFNAFVAEELRRWGPIVKASGAKND